MSIEVDPHLIKRPSFRNAAIDVVLVVNDTMFTSSLEMPDVEYDEFPHATTRPSLRRAANPLVVEAMETTPDKSGCTPVESPP